MAGIGYSSYSDPRLQPHKKDSGNFIQQAFNTFKRLHTCNMAECAKNIIVRRHPESLNFWWGIYKNFPHLAIKLLQRQCRLLHLKLHAFTTLVFIRNSLIAQIKDKISQSSHRNNHTQQRNQPRQSTHNISNCNRSSKDTGKNKQLAQPAIKPDMPFAQANVIRQIKLSFIFSTCFWRCCIHEFLTVFLTVVAGAWVLGEAALVRVGERLTFSQNPVHPQSVPQSWLAPWGLMVVGTSIINAPRGWPPGPQRSHSKAERAKPHEQAWIEQQRIADAMQEGYA
ncbi:hypothetical protein XF_2517 [Xylella fastidiosa 9a5c]|uniref:Uncharacterized protein n=1 Tax=Xylella fastidiosa (strain 9a5c) TaxID=160492 RepID=Q9PAJ8_XYLFA|nr:hypothetical protein XF_2517 [Xylella fastidiosa 9a5c]